jgi:hypothetical protein
MLSAEHGFQLHVPLSGMCHRRKRVSRWTRGRCAFPRNPFSRYGIVQDSMMWMTARFTAVAHSQKTGFLTSARRANDPTRWCALRAVLRTASKTHQRLPLPRGGNNTSPARAGQKPVFSLQYRPAFYHADDTTVYGGGAFAVNGFLAGRAPQKPVFSKQYPPGYYHADESAVYGGGPFVENGFLAALPFAEDGFLGSPAVLTATAFCVFYPRKHNRTHCQPSSLTISLVNEVTSCSSCSICRPRLPFGSSP